MPVFGGGGQPYNPLFPMNSFYSAVGGSESVSAGATVYFPSYSYAVGILVSVNLNITRRS